MSNEFREKKKANQLNIANNDFGIALMWADLSCDGFRYWISGKASHCNSNANCMSVATQYRKQEHGKYFRDEWRSEH